MVLNARQICPSCGMRMIVVAGFKLDSPDQQTHECLRCGKIESPQAAVPSQDGEQERLGRDVGGRSKKRGAQGRRALSPSISQSS